MICVDKKLEIKREKEKKKEKKQGGRVTCKLVKSSSNKRHLPNRLLLTLHFSLSHFRTSVPGPATRRLHHPHTLQPHSAPPSTVPLLFLPSSPGSHTCTHTCTRPASPRFSLILFVPFPAASSMASDPFSCRFFHAHPIRASQGCLRCVPFSSGPTSYMWLRLMSRFRTVGA